MAFVRRERKYYKYAYRDWVQPVLTANGEIGGKDFACFVGSNYSSNPAYYAFDGKDTTAWASNLTDTQDYIGFYNPEPLLVTEIICTNKSWITGLWEVYGSNDNIAYELIASGENTDATDGSTFTIDLSSNKKAYNYYKIQCLTTLANSRVGMGEIKITATEQYPVEVPVESITDFGSYKYYKNVVTTKYWKEITTGSRELEYACYIIDSTKAYTYLKEISIDEPFYGIASGGKVDDSSLLTIQLPSGALKSINEDSFTFNVGIGGDQTATRYSAGDLYIDTTITETVEGTPEDYTYTTEEIVPVEVDGYVEWNQPILTADDSDPDFTVSASTRLNSTVKSWHSFSSRTRGWISDYISVIDLPHYYYITTTKPLKVSKITIRKDSTDDYASVPIGVWQASENNEDWIDIVEFGNLEDEQKTIWSFEPNEKVGYKYHRFKFTGVTNEAPNIYLGFPYIQARVWGDKEFKEEDLVFGKDYDFTEFVPSTQYDYHVDNNKMYNLTRPHREYYKYGTELDVTAEGSFASINEGIASGFSTADYLLLHEAFDVSAGQSWEMVFKITTGDNISTAQAFVGNVTANYDPVWMAVQSSKFRIVLASSTSSSIFDKTGTYTVTANTTYWVRLTFDGATYNLDYSLDGLEYVNDITVASTKTIHSQVPAIGISLADSAKKYPFLGLVHLKESHISINGERWWSGNNYTKVGSWIEKGIVGSFTTAKYLVNNKGIFNTKQPWESVISFTTGSDVSTSQAICCNAIGYWGYGVGVISGKLRIGLSNSTSSFNIVENKDIDALANTKYWVKTVFNGENYTCTYSTDGKNYLEVFSIDSTTTVSSGIPRYGVNDVSKLPFLGTIDFSESYIKIDGEFWWRGLGGLGGGTYTATAGWGNVANAFDHISNTYATCATPTDYIEYDFGREVYVNGFIATGQYVSGSARPMDLRIYNVDDAGNETLLGNGTGSAATSVYTTKATFPRVKTTKVRFRLTETNYEGNPPLASVPTRIREIRMLGSRVGYELYHNYDYYIDRIKYYNLKTKES